MSQRGYFRLLQLYSDLWTRAHCRVIISGQQHVESTPRERSRVYLVSHPTTYDLPVLAHISRRPFYVVVAHGPFSHPIVGWLFRNVGFPMLRPDSGEEVVRQSLRLLGTGVPMIYSLKGYGVDFGEESRPRTGGIRIAHLAGADIFPVHLMIEPGKMLFKWYRDRRGSVYPYTVFRNTLYFATFCEPLRYEEYARRELGYEDYRELAQRVSRAFEQTQAELESDLAGHPERYRALRRWGGADRRVLL